MERNNDTTGSRGRQSFHFWWLTLACFLVVGFCGLSAWVISTYFYE